jgi:plasmid stability protein
MTQITIRNIDDAVRLKLRTRAAAKGRSLEAELREIITRAASEAAPWWSGTANPAAEPGTQAA